jgi:deoxyribonuclease-4
MQIFSRSPRAFREIPLRQEDIEEFRRRRLQTDIKPVFIHLPYLVNLASPYDKLYKSSIRLYIDSIGDAQALGAEYIVTHMGSHKGKGEQRGLDRFATAVNIILNETRDTNVGILLENTAGSGFALGYNFSHQEMVINKIEDKQRIGVCFDTCHGYVAGYDIVTAQGLKETIDKIQRHIGLRYLKLIHLNDAKDILGSRRDRHEHIGKGRIGLKGFRNIVNHPKLKNIPFILETPKFSEKDDIMNLKIIRSLLD